MNLFDSHCHLQDRAFAGETEAVIARAEAAGVSGMLLCGYDQASNRAALDIAAGTQIVHAAVGFHPHDAIDLTPERLDELERQACLPAVVAVGELGLDYYRDLSPRDAQHRALEAQLAIAATLGKPVAVHSRSAEDAIFPFLRQFAARFPAGRRPGVMHCFGGTFAQAKLYLDLGFGVSIACTVTYPRNDVTRELAAAVPLDALVVETDAPYLPPQPLRGKRNEPAHVGEAVRAIAALRGLDVHAVAETTTANARALFGLDAMEVAA
jgi:TatD DNase family protein